MPVGLPQIVIHHTIVHEYNPVGSVGNLVDHVLRMKYKDRIIFRDEGAAGVRRSDFLPEPQMGQSTQLSCLCVSGRRNLRRIFDTAILDNRTIDAQTEVPAQVEPLGRVREATHPRAIDIAADDKERHFQSKITWNY